MNRRSFLAMPAVVVTAGESAPFPLPVTPVSYLDNWAAMLGVASKAPGESDESLKRRLQAAIKGYNYMMTTGLMTPERARRG